MPRKVKSSGESTQGKNTSLKRATGASKGGKRTGHSEVPDGGKWAGSGRKTVEHREGPEMARLPIETGRGAKTRKGVRTASANPPNHG